MNLGPHAAYIWLSYAAVTIAVAGLIGWLYLDGKRYQKRLTELEARGVRRRSSAS